MTVFIATDSTYIIIVQAVFIILYRAEYMEISTVVSIQTIFGSYPDNTEFILINRRDCGLWNAIFYSDRLEVYILSKRKSRNL